MRYKKLALSILIITAPASLLAEEEPIEEEPIILPTVTVEGEYLPEPSISRKKTEDILGTTVIDSGDFLRRFSGVSGTRMGGHGIDPIIRGQNQTRLNILLDGAYIHGGCPNRMDPPTAYSSIETYDTVTVLKGAQTVIYGGGGSGGTVLFERKTPRLTEDQSLYGQFGGGYTSNSATKKLFGDVTAGNTQGFVRGIVEYMDTNNYEDGDGNETRTAVINQTGHFILGYTPSDKTRFELGIEASRADDALYAGAAMDSPQSDNDTFRFRFETEWGTKGELYYSDVEHVMDNYSLRPLSAPMKMLVDAKSKTEGGRVSHNWLMGNDMEWTLGMDYQHNNRDANRFSGPKTVLTPTNVQSIMWPDVDLTQIGVFGEMVMPVREVDMLKLGLRYDRVTSEANRATQAAMGGKTPNTLYKKYYGKTADEHDENNLGGFIRYEQELNGGNGFTFVSLSRAVRTADASERFLAANHTKAALRWIGNPDLEPEQHHQIEVGFSLQTNDNWDVATSLFYNEVTDYILRDRVHLPDDNASIYRNVDARLYGFEWEGDVQWSADWSSHVAFDYVYAINTTDDRHLAQIPPFSGLFSMDYKQPKYHVGGILRYAAKQKNVDDDPSTGSGLDAQKTPIFSVLDFYGILNLNKATTIKVGINNIFNKNYAYHVNRANVDPFNSEAVQVNEPGRAFWVNFVTQF
jgi:iron complex outermembrane receptor protein